VIEPNHSWDISPILCLHLFPFIVFCHINEKKLIRLQFRLTWKIIVPPEYEFCRSCKTLLLFPPSPPSQIPEDEPCSDVSLIYNLNRKFLHILSRYEVYEILSMNYD
jgi:hypothetical protein